MSARLPLSGKQNETQSTEAQHRTASPTAKTPSWSRRSYLLFGVFVLVMLLIIANNLYRNRLRSDILKAAQAGDLNAIRSLLARDPALCHVGEDKQRTPLTYILGGERHISPERIEAARLLLEAGANPNVWSTRFRCNVLTAACQAGNLDLVKLLLDRGAKIGQDVPFSYNLPEPPLCEAIQQNNAPLADLLLAHGANMYQTCRFGRSPLVVAANNRHLTCLQLLLQAGADPNLPDSSGIFPLQFAGAERPPTAAPDVEIVRVLLKAGANVNMRSISGWTPLLLAVHNGDTASVQLLLQNRADPNLRYRRGNTALQEAEKLHHTQIAALLRKAITDR